MKKKTLLVLAVLIIAAVVPIVAFQAQAVLSAGPNQQVYTGQITKFNGTTTDNATLITQVIWNFGDNSTIVNGTSSTLLNTTHLYTATGVYNATLSVTFGGALNKTDTANAQITVLQNIAPVANAGADQFVQQTSLQGANVTLNGSGSTDPNNDTLTYNWTWANNSAAGVIASALFPPGNTTVTLRVSDGQLNATDMVNIVVRDTAPPFVTIIPQNVSVEAGTPVTLNGTATDTISTRFNFTWSENGIVLKTQANATGTTLTNNFSFGTHVVMLNATDQAGNMGSANATVRVADTTPPTITATVMPSSLWPPNHKYVEVKVNVTASDLGDPAPKITFVSMTSNEPDNANGDGNSVDDIVMVDNFTFNVRAERAGTGSGRIYTITYKATDASNNTATASVTITVPHSP